MFYYPSKSVLQMLQMLENAVANLNNVLRMKSKCQTWVSNLHNTYWELFLVVLYLPGPVQLAYFPSNLDQFSTFTLHSAEMSIRMQVNLYKRLTITYKCLTITTHVLPLIRMAFDCSLLICCEYAFLTNFRSMFLIFARPRECLQTPQESLRTPTNVMQSSRIGAELHPKHIRLGVRAAKHTSHAFHLL